MLSRVDCYAKRFLRLNSIIERKFYPAEFCVISINFRIAVVLAARFNRRGWRKRKYRRINWARCNPASLPSQLLLDWTMFENKPRELWKTQIGERLYLGEINGWSDCWTPEKYMRNRGYAEEPPREQCNVYRRSLLQKRRVLLLAVLVERSDVNKRLAKSIVLSSSLLYLGMETVHLVALLCCW